MKQNKRVFACVLSRKKSWPWQDPSERKKGKKYAWLLMEYILLALSLGSFPILSICGFLSSASPSWLCVPGVCVPLPRNRE